MRKDLIYVRIDKRRKFLASTLLLALDDEKTTEYRKNVKRLERILIIIKLMV